MPEAAFAPILGGDSGRKLPCAGTGGGYFRGPCHT